jgi:hypothetical protein
MDATLPALQTVFDGGTAAQKATFQASVSRYVNFAALKCPTIETVPASGAPTLLLTGTTAPTGVVTYGHSDPAFDYLGPGPFVLRADTAFLRASPNAASYVSNQWASTAPEFYLRQENANTKATLFYDEFDGLGYKYGGLITLTSAGTREYVKVTFAERKPRKFKLCGFNLTFGGILQVAGDPPYRIERPAEIMMVVGDSYTQGSGAISQFHTWAGYMSESLGYELYADGIGSTGWLTASPNTPAERISKFGPVNLVRRNADVDVGVPVTRMVYALGYNDSSGSQSAIATQIDLAVSALASAGVVKPFFIGPWTPLGDTTNLTTTAATIRNRATAADCTFVSAQGIVTANNKAFLTGVDNVHPTNYGHKHIGFELARRIRAAGAA